MDVKNERAQIKIQSCSARIATTSKTYFVIELYSACFEGVIKTAPNNDWKVNNNSSDALPVWKGQEPLAAITPIATEEAYLEQQHILMLLKSLEGDEPYGKYIGQWVWSNHHSNETDSMLC